MFEGCTYLTADSIESRCCLVLQGITEEKELINFFELIAYQSDRWTHEILMRILKICNILKSKKKNKGFFVFENRQLSSWPTKSRRLSQF